MKISILGMIGFAFIFALVAITTHLTGYSVFGMVDFIVALFGLLGMVTILSHPWDLYFEARNLRLEQAESLRKSIKIPQEDVDYTNRLVPRLLLTCLSLHLLAAAVAFATAWFSHGVIGYWFSGFFLLSTAFRPVHAFHVHMKTRLFNLRARCLVPREDAVDLATRLRSIESDVKDLQIELKKDREQTLEALEKNERNFETLRSGTTTEVRRFNDRVSAVCDEFRKSIEKLTEDQELLRGIRAFVHMVKTTS
ncbi:MAG: hypothetical protein WA705_22755 [Candidatus Ozemobacteraceae bacterium]